MKTFSLLSVLAVSALLSAPSLQAGTIGPNCGTCYGSTYTLNYLGLVGSTATTQTHQISLTIDATGFVEPTRQPNQYISAVAIKVSNSVTNGSLVSGPGGIGNWQVKLSGLSANNCSGSGSGFLCAEDPSPNAAQTNVANPVYTWVFQMTTPTGDLFTGVNAAHIKANYDPMGGTLVSEDITLGGAVPEPTEISLLLGGIGVWWWTRRRKLDTAKA